MHVVISGIFLCVEDRWFDDLNAIDLPCFLREEKRNRSRPTVGINDRLLPFQVGEFQGFAVKDLGLRCIDLKERAR